MGHVDYLSAFYFGNDHPGLKKQLENKVDEIDARNVSRIPLGKPEDGAEVVVRVGRYGPFIEQGDGERRASIPENMPPDELSLEVALEMLDKSAQGEEPLGQCPETGKPVYMKIGRFGPYVQRGDADDEEKQNASLLKGMEPHDIDLETALKLLSLPRNLGVHPENGEPVMAHSGRFGPYVKWGDETRSLPADTSPLEVTLEKAVELLAQPKAGRGAKGKKEPIKVFAESPVTGNPVQLLDGRYGPYVTDGATNASLPRSMSPDEMTLERALDMLAERAAKGGTKKPAKKAATTKKATKKAVKKKSAKKATKKKSE
jgi:DNA topoisomerase-1